jgi:hypothetical protein
MTMFKKVFKYDFAYVKRFWWIIAASVLGLSFLGSLVYRFVATFQAARANSVEMFLFIMGVVFLFACFIAIPVSFFVPQVLCCVRYYKNFFTDEGYLTFTLPVSRKTLLLSKMVNTVLWSVIHGLLLLVSGAIVITIAPVPNRGQLLDLHIWEGIGKVLEDVWEYLGAWSLVYLLEGILMVLAATWFGCALIYMCMTIGAVVAKKHKVLAAFGVYYGVNMGFSFVMQIAMVLGLAFVVLPLGALLAEATYGMACTLVALLLLMILMIEVAVACLFHFLTLGKLEQKLNLS